MGRYLNVILIIAVSVGAIVLFNRQSALSTLRAEHQRLADKVGVLGVKDPKKYQIVRVDTGDPTHFLWRAYHPSSVHYSTSFKNRSGGGSSSGSSENAGEFLIRLRFELQPDQLRVHRLTGGSGGVSTTIDSPYTRFLFENWDKLDIQVTDEGTFDADQKINLFEVNLTDELRDSLKGAKHWSLKQLQTDSLPLYLMEFGSEDAIDAAEEERRKQAEQQRLAGEKSNE